MLNWLQDIWNAKASEALRRAEGLEDPSWQHPSDEVGYKQLKGHTIVIRSLIHLNVKATSKTFQKDFEGTFF